MILTCGYQGTLFVKKSNNTVTENENIFPEGYYFFWRNKDSYNTTNDLSTMISSTIIKEVSDVVTVEYKTE